MTRSRFAAVLLLCLGLSNTACSGDGEVAETKPGKGEDTTAQSKKNADATEETSKSAPKAIAYQFLIMLAGNGKYRVKLNGILLPAQGERNEFQVRIPETKSFRELNRLEVNRTYEDSRNGLNATASIEIPSLGFPRWRPRSNLDFGIVAAGQCRSENGPKHPRTESEAIARAIYWENVLNACTGVAATENTQIRALEQALFAQKWLVQNYPEDYVISSDLLHQASTMIETNGRCKAKHCASLEKEVLHASFIDYKLYDPLTRLTHIGLEKLTEHQLSAATDALVLSEKLYNECPKDAKNRVCDWANFPQLRLNLCREVERRKLAGIQTCPLPNDPTQ